MFILINFLPYNTVIYIIYSRRPPEKHKTTDLVVCRLYYRDHYRAPPHAACLTLVVFFFMPASKQHGHNRLEYTLLYEKILTSRYKSSIFENRGMPRESKCRDIFFFRDDFTFLLRVNTIISRDEFIANSSRFQKCF